MERRASVLFLVGVSLGPAAFTALLARGLPRVTGETAGACALVIGAITLLALCWTSRVHPLNLALMWVAVGAAGVLLATMVEHLFGSGTAGVVVVVAASTAVVLAVSGWVGAHTGRPRSPSSAKYGAAALSVAVASVLGVGLGLKGLSGPTSVLFAALFTARVVHDVQEIECGHISGSGGIVAGVLQVYRGLLCDLVNLALAFGEAE